MAGSLTRVFRAVGILWLVCLAGCASSDSPRQVFDSVPAVFDELFVPVDTVQLAASVLIGTTAFMDVSPDGDFLIADEMQRVFHIFSASGNHVRTFSSKDCNPEEGARSSAGRFLADGRMVVSTSTGHFIFDVDGNCERRIPDLPIAHHSFCPREDSIYVMLHLQRPPQVHVYALKSGGARHYELREPKFPKATQVKRGRLGREIACFDDAVYFRYPESSDGEPLWSGPAQIRFRLPFYRAPQRDMGGGGSMNSRIDDLRQLSREFTYSTGIFELDEFHRMVTFNARYGSGEVSFHVVDSRTQTSLHSETDRIIRTAKNGYLYLEGDYEELSSGELGNRMIEVLRFVPLENSANPMPAP